jgi:hypothetical protein
VGSNVAGSLPTLDVTVGGGVAVVDVDVVDVVAVSAGP